MTKKLKIKEVTAEEVQEVAVSVEKTHKEIMEERLLLVFGEDCVDFLTTGGVVIHFPDIDITNGILSQNIKDLFVKLKWTYDDKDMVANFTNDMYGLRTSFTDEELYSKYSHSHLSVLYFDNEEDGEVPEDEDGNIPNRLMTVQWNSFCTGDDSLGKTLAGLGMGFQMDKFFILLNLIDEFVRWESLDGGPYIKIERIIRADTSYYEIDHNTTTQFSIDKVVTHFYKQAIETENLGELDYFVDNNELKMLDQRVAMDKIGEILLSNDMEGGILSPRIPKVKLYRKKFYATHSGAGDLSEYANNIDFDGGITFKGNYVIPAIVGMASERTELTEKIEEKAKDVVHPYVTASILHLVETKLFKALNKKDKWKLRK